MWPFPAVQCAAYYSCIHARTHRDIHTPTNCSLLCSFEQLGGKITSTFALHASHRSDCWKCIVSKTLLRIIVHNVQYIGLFSCFYTPLVNSWEKLLDFTMKGKPKKQPNIRFLFGFDDIRQTDMHTLLLPAWYTLSAFHTPSSFKASSIFGVILCPSAIWV